MEKQSNFAPGWLLLERANVPYGHERITFFQCVDCKTSYPQLTVYDWKTMNHRLAIKCNGEEIVFCPWCRSDSQPWKYGRGI
jgi:hypothetical protein